jgi:hypothetical protein
MFEMRRERMLFIEVGLCATPVLRILIHLSFSLLFTAVDFLRSRRSVGVLSFESGFVWGKGKRWSGGEKARALDHYVISCVVQFQVIGMMNHCVISYSSFCDVVVNIPIILKLT